MGFKQLNLNEVRTFNSGVTCNFVETYNNGLDAKLRSEIQQSHFAAFAPSGVRCARQQWFRLRGVNSDVPNRVDTHLDFTAMLGTAIHKYVQTVLRDTFQENWLSVEDFLRDHQTPYPVTANVNPENDLEYQVQIANPPVRFACDGLIRIDGVVYLVEIKTCDSEVFRHLTGIKEIHSDQVRCYSTLLNVPNVIVIYVDRNYGNIKCYEYTITASAMDKMKQYFADVLLLVERNIAPEKLPSGDYVCSNCSYQHKCKLW